MKHIAIFASGSGTNAERIMTTFADHPSIKVQLVLSNKPTAFVLQRARRFNVKTQLFNRKQFYETDEILRLLEHEHIDFIVLAGFLWLVPENILKAYSGRIINIHPALLPKYGGKGMFGEHVHQAVIANGDTESGISIHYVNPDYDRGDIIFQARCPVLPGDTPETLAARVHQLEYTYFPRVIEEVLEKSK